MSNTPSKRSTFNSRLGFILVSAGCAIGLGNVWKFPYVCSQNGGGAFLVIYLLCLVMLGLPILVCEFAVGRKSRQSIACAYDKLEPDGTHWHFIKYMCVSGNYLLMMFYTMVTGWMLYYVYKYASGNITSVPQENLPLVFEGILASPGKSFLFTSVVIILGMGVCALGLQKGIEKITKYIMSALIILMVILVVNSLCLKGSFDGVSFYLKPDFGKLMDQGLGNVTFAAMTQAFFTISVGIGSMEIFGSYMKKDRSLTGEAINVVALDTAIAIMAGLVIIPACFAYGVEPDAGPSLLFKTLPNVFANMTGGRIWGLIFFLFMSFAAFTTVIAVFENIVSMTEELWNIPKKKAVVLNLFAMLILSLPAVLGFSILSEIQLLGKGTNIMDFEDFLVSCNVLPLGSLIIVLFCTKKNGWGWNRFIKEANIGVGIKFPSFLRLYMKFFIPALICIIYLKGYYDMFAGKSTPVFIGWMTFGVLLLIAILSIAIFSKPKSRQ
ncbi:MAG: sodium-dependent transporter [Ruminococcus sp.]